MGQKTFDLMLGLAGLGYTVSFSKVEEFKPAQVLRIELSKGINHHMELVDISIRDRIFGMTTDDLVSRALEKAKWEFEYDFEREKNARSLEILNLLH